MTTITTYEDPLSGAERHRAVQRALADARRLAQLQTEILVRLEEADRAGDDEAVLCCHAELDHVMARITETEQVRTGARSSLPGQDDLTCAGCGWSGDGPDAQAERKRTEVLGAAAAAIAPAAQTLTEIMATLDRRGRQARSDGLAAPARAPRHADRRRPAPPPHCLSSPSGRR